LRRPLAALLLTACADGPEGQAERDPCAPGREPTLAIGGGVSRFEPLREGDTLELVHGPQGGYHVEIGLRATGLAADDLLSGKLEGWIGDRRLAEVAPWFDFRCNPGVGQDSWGTLLVYAAQPEDLDGQPTTVVARVIDSRGVEVEAELDLVIEDPLL
jgi:hypothetical protein